MIQYSMKERFSPHNGEIILKIVTVPEYEHKTGFSPHNGEIILKYMGQFISVRSEEFQSPQWGDNSKVGCSDEEKRAIMFQSPQWGDNSKVLASEAEKEIIEFQSPQWGDNSKDVSLDTSRILQVVSVPTMGR